MPGKSTGLVPTGLCRRGRILACAGLLLFSCRPPLSVPEPMPVDTLLQAMDEASGRLRDFRGSARIETSFDGRRGLASLRIRYRSPARFRIDIHGALFQVLAVVLIHDRRVRLYLPRENTVFEGELGTPDSPIPGLDLTLEDVRTAVTGTIESGRYAAMQVVDYRAGGGKAAVTLRDGGVNRTLRIDTEKMTVTREDRVSVETRVSVVRTFTRFRKRNGIWCPGSVRMTRSGAISGTMELTYRTQSVNRGLSRSDTDVRLPATVVRRPLEEAAFELESMEETSFPGATRERFPINGS